MKIGPLYANRLEYDETRASERVNLRKRLHVKLSYCLKNEHQVWRRTAFFTFNNYVDERRLAMHVGRWNRALLHLLKFPLLCH